MLGPLLTSNKEASLFCSAPPPSIYKLLDCLGLLQVSCRSIWLVGALLQAVPTQGWTVICNMMPTFRLGDGMALPSGSYSSSRKKPATRSKVRHFPS